MLHSFSAMTGYAIRATDGDVGSLEDLYFDDSSTQVRYLVVDTGTWLDDRRVLLAPAALGVIDADQREIRSALTCEQVETSPPIDNAKPVSRQQEEALHRHFTWQPYWGTATLTGGVIPNWGVMIDAERPANENRLKEEIASMERESSDPHLQSALEVRDYHIGAVDGEIGSITDFLVDDSDWSIRFLVVDTGNWLPGRKVVVSPHSIRGVNWTERRIEVDLTQERIKDSPQFDPSVIPDRTFWERLQDYYGLPPT